MEKLLHERMREWANSDEPNYRPMQEMGIIHGWSYGRMKGSEFLNKLADEIERYYIPRPRFEDGEPVQDSDMEEIGGMATCCVYTDGSWIFEPDKYEDTANPKQWDRQSGMISDRIKRPQPKVLDADGVEIKVGDTVYYTVTGTKRIVERIENDEVYFTTGLYGTPDNLTHKEPDSIEKIIKSIEEEIETVESGSLGFTVADMESWAQRLSAFVYEDADSDVG